MLASIQEMGFSENKAKKALKATKNSGLQQALEWLVDNSEKITDSPIESEEEATAEVEAQSYVCSNCGKKLRNQDEVEFHSAKTGHTDYEESADKVQQLTPEERKAQLDRLHEKIKLRKKERDEQEKKEELERERRRRQDGRNIGDMREKFEHDEMLRIADEKRREKEADRLYKEKLKAEIARERAEKLARDRQEVIAQPPRPKPTPPKPVATDECRIQVRLPQGPPLVHTFQSKEPLSAVRLFICEHWKQHNSAVEIVDVTRMKISTTFPKKDFSEDEMQRTLAELNLCPATALIAHLF